MLKQILVDFENQNLADVMTDLGFKSKLTKKLAALWRVLSEITRHLSAKPLSAARFSKPSSICSQKKWLNICCWCLGGPGRWVAADSQSEARKSCFDQSKARIGLKKCLNQS